MFRRTLLALLFSTSIATALPIGNPAGPQLLRCPAFPERFEPPTEPVPVGFGGVTEAGEYVLDTTDRLVRTFAGKAFTLLSDFFPFVPASGRLIMELGYYGDFVFERNMYVVGQGDVTKTSFYTNAVEIVANLENFLELFATIGATHHHFEFAGAVIAPATPLLFDPYRFELDTSRNMSWSVGTRMTAFTCHRFTLGLEAQYFRTVTTLDSLVAENNFGPGFLPAARTNPTAVRFWYGEWQVGAALGRTWEITCASLQLSPYLGLKFSGARAKIPDLTFKSSKTVGYALGSSIAVGKAVSVNVEGRWADETALSVKGLFTY